MRERTKLLAVELANNGTPDFFSSCARYFLPNSLTVYSLIGLPCKKRLLHW